MSSPMSSLVAVSRTTLPVQPECVAVIDVLVDILDVLVDIRDVLYVTSAARGCFGDSTWRGRSEGLE